MSSSSEEIPKLPVWATVSDAGWFVYENFDYLARIAWISVLILIGSKILVAIPGLGERVGIAILWLVNTFVFSSIAVAWHRRILLQEISGDSKYFRTDNLVRAYFGIGILLGVIIPFGMYLVPTMVISRFVGSGGTGGALAVAVFLFLLAFWVVARLSLVLPAKAIGSEVVSLGNVWEISRNYGWQLMVGLLLCIVPVLPLLFILFPIVFSLGLLPVFFSIPLLAVVDSSVVVIAEAVCIGFLSFAFKRIYGLSDGVDIIESDE